MQTPFRCNPLQLLIGTVLLLVSALIRAEITVTYPEIRETPEHYMVTAQFSYELGESVVEALKNGIPLAFVAKYQVEEVTPFWIEDKIIHQEEHRFVLSYREFTNRFYLVSLKNNSHGAYDTIEEAIRRMTMRHNALIIEKSLLSGDQQYQANIRASIDSSALPGLIRPYVYTPYLWPEWKLDSGWHTIQIRK